MTHLSLLDRHPVMSTEAMLAHFVPPAQFRNASLDNYVTLSFLLRNKR